MNSRERLLTTIRHQEPDHVPLYAWAFGFPAPEALRWSQGGRAVNYWYTGRMEYLHTLPEPWDYIADDCRRVEAWLSLGLDDMLEVSVPWGMHPSVTFRDERIPPSASEPHWLIAREYTTPAGPLRHVVRLTEERSGPGWVIQPTDQVPLFEDYNIPRGVKHAVTDAADVERLAYLLRPPDDAQAATYREHVAALRRFADQKGVLVQAWSAFGMDAVIWLCGVEGALLLALDQPDTFQALLDLIFAWDRQRTAFALDVGQVELVVMRGWYSATTFWSPDHFRRYVAPYVRQLAHMVHEAGRLFGYTVTTGLMPVLDDFAALGVDLLYYADPAQGGMDLRVAKAKLGGKVAMAGGVNSGVTLHHGTPDEVRRQVHEAIRTLGPGGGFILSPVDALFPDTPWHNVQAMIEAWRELCNYPIH